MLDLHCPCSGRVPPTATPIKTEHIFNQVTECLTSGFEIKTQLYLTGTGAPVLSPSYPKYHPLLTTLASYVPYQFKV